MLSINLGMRVLEIEKKKIFLNFSKLFQTHYVTYKF